MDGNLVATCLEKQHGSRVRSKITSVTIPDSVTSIGNWAFEGCSSLKSITIPNSITNIGASAFYCCNSLKNITIPDSVTSIGNYVFSFCTSLASITIPDSVVSIGYGALRNCNSLTSVTIPDSVTSIGEEAFLGTGEGFYISCKMFSTAEDYAIENNIPFEHTEYEIEKDDLIDTDDYR